MKLYIILTVLFKFARIRFVLVYLGRLGEVSKCGLRKNDVNVLLCSYSK